MSRNFVSNRTNVCGVWKQVGGIRGHMFVYALRCWIFARKVLCGFAYNPKRLQTGEWRKAGGYHLMMLGMSMIMVIKKSEAADGAVIEGSPHYGPDVQTTRPPEPDGIIKKV